MAIELRRLVEKVRNMDITLVAGEKGVHHLVSWVHMVETVEAADFLVGGEIAFITGIGLHEKEDFADLIHSIYEKNAAGVVVNIGPFVEKIDQKTIDYCDEHEFPLYVVPWRIHLAEIIRIFCFSITKADQKMLEVAAGFKNAIFFPKQEELYVVPLSQRNFNVNWRYSVGVLRVETPQGILSERLEMMIGNAENYLVHQYDGFVLFLYDSEIIVVAGNMTDEVHKEFIEKLRQRILQCLKPEETLTMGVGRMTKSIRCVYKSYNQAKSIEKLQRRHKISTDTFFYSDMGLYRLIIGIDDVEIMTEYYNCTIGALVDFDENKGTDYCAVLRSYLNHNGSVKETADELFVHRNTINYKLNRIEELLEIDLSPLSTRLELMIAFTLMDMMR